MKTEKRKFFIGGLIIIGVILYMLCGTIIQGVRRISTVQVSNPNFRCEVVNGDLVKTIDGNNQVVLMVKIVNSGSQSIAWKWHLKLDLVSGQTMEADASENPSNIGIKDGPVVLPAGTYLPNVLLESPISNGSGKKGWVGFVLKDISPEDMERIGNRFTLSFQDSDGHVIEASETIRKKVVGDFLFGSGGPAAQ